MLEFTGSIKGKAYEREAISADKLMELFPSLKINMDKSYVFQLDKNLVKKDTLNSREKVALGRSYAPILQGSYEGNSIFVRIFDQKTPKPGKVGEYNYSPRRLEFKGKEIRLNPKEDKEKILFFMLMKNCGTSPLRSKNDKVDINMIDKEGEARKKLAFAKIAKEVSDEIFNMPDADLLKKAKGIRVKGRGITINTNTSAAEARLDLIALMDRDKKEFVKAYKNVTTDIRGMIQQSIDKGYITLKHMDGGARGWYYQTGEFITKFSSGVQAIDSIIAYVTNQNNYLGFRERINNLAAEANLTSSATDIKALIAQAEKDEAELEAQLKAKMDRIEEMKKKLESQE